VQGVPCPKIGLGAILGAHDHILLGFFGAAAKLTDLFPEAAANAEPPRRAR